MDVLTLGWELPPYFAGGVGVVCEALTRALAALGNRITYLMPYGPKDAASAHMALVTAASVAADIEVERIPSALQSYAASAGPGFRIGTAAAGPRALYGPDLLEAVEEFATRALAVLRRRDLRFDVIHAHDWTTFRAGLALRRATGKPLITHVHITEFDKSGGTHANPAIYALEREGICGADRVLAVSQRVKDTCVERYGADPARIEVVYNAVDPDTEAREPVTVGNRIVLFLGRVTLQKGPEYFLEAARKVADLEDDVTFVLAGSGDMLPRMIERVAELGLARRVLFPGFVDREQAAALFQSADVFVMPSVSEPFGIVPLEAMDQEVPVIVSRQSGVAEVLRNALKVDFWDTDDLAAKILAALRYPRLAGELGRMGKREVSQLTWRSVAERVERIYEEVRRA